jgi:hypothetical protein
LLFSSQNAGVHSSAVYDNFTLASATNITGISFTGGYYRMDGGVPVIGTTAFEVGFFADNGGQPWLAPALWSATIPGNGGESCGGGPTPICTYDLDVDFNADAGVQYWLSIISDSAFPTQWGWAEGSGGDGSSHAIFDGIHFANEADLAFALNPNPVPEPSSWAMMLLGLGAGGVALRRTRRLRNGIVLHNG